MTTFLNDVSVQNSQLSVVGAGCSFKLADGTEGVDKVLVSNASGVATWQLPSVLLGSGFFKQGGNSFGQDATLGTNDTYGLGIRTNGIDRITVKNNGFVGVNNTNPQYSLDVSGIIAVDGARFVVNDSGNNLIYAGTNGNLDFYNYNGTSFRGRWDINGNLGLGTFNPLYKLHVKGNIGLQDDSYIQGAAGAVSFLTSGNGAQFLRSYGAYFGPDYSHVLPGPGSIYVNGNATVKTLSSVATPPSVSGITKVVITDENGLLSFVDSSTVGGVYTQGTGITINSSKVVSANLSTGVSGGQAATGGTGPVEDLVLRSTSHSLKGRVVIGSSGFSETDGWLSIGTNAYANYPLEVNGAGKMDSLYVDRIYNGQNPLSVPQIDLTTSTITDSTNNQSINWEDRFLLDGAGQLKAQWNTMFNVYGSQGYSTKIVTTDTHTVAENDYVILVHSTPSNMCTITLPDPAGYPGRVLKIRALGAVDVTLNSYNGIYGPAIDYKDNVPYGGTGVTTTGYLAFLGGGSGNNAYPNYPNTPVPEWVEMTAVDNEWYVVAKGHNLGAIY